MPGILSRMERRTLENPATPISSANIVETLQLGTQSVAGVSVTQEKALGLTAFWAGVRMISQTVAMLPCECFEVERQGYRRAVEHRAHKLVYIRPNPMMTPFTFKEVRIAHLLTWGNAYCEIEYDAANQPIALWPLLPDRTGVELRSGEKVYWTTVGGQKVWLEARRVLHTPGLGFDGIQGYNVIKLHKDALGQAIATNQYGAEFFANSGRPSGLLVHPASPNPEERKALRESWNQMHTGLTKAQRTAIMWGGMKYEAISVPPEDAQYLGSREMSIEEVARILNINPILLQHFTKATTWGSGVAEFLTAFGTLTITPWCERDEDVLNHDLFTEAERGRFYVKYNTNALLRGDPETQAKVLEIKRRNGIINADEWRALSEENPLPDGLGQVYIVPLNMVPVDQLVNPPEPPPTVEPEPSAASRSVPARENRSPVMRRRLQEAHRSAFEDGARRYVKRDVEALRKAIRKAFESSDPIAHMSRWVDEFYPGQQVYIAQAMLPLVATLAAVIAAEAADEVGAEVTDTAVFAQEYAAALAVREAGSSRGQVKALTAEVPAEELEAALTTRADEWAEKRPGKVAQNEIVRVATGAARYAWAAVGITYLVWRAGPKACELCQQMDGRKVGIADYFLKSGESVTPSGVSGLVADSNVAGPPLHQGCGCSIVPER